MIWLLLAGCGTTSTVDKRWEREVQLHRSCVKMKNYGDCYELADMTDDASEASLGLHVACTGGFKDSCKRYVREHHQTKSRSALSIAARRCFDNGELCEDVLKFRDLYPEHKQMLDLAVPIAEAKLAEKGTQ